MMNCIESVRLTLTSHEPGAIICKELALSTGEWQSIQKAFSRASAKMTVQARTGGWCMKLVPLEDRVIVRVLDEEERTSSGIVLPDTAKEKPQKAKVVAVGPGRYEDGKQIPVGVSEGDTVVFSKYGGSEVAVEGEELLVLRASDILAKVE